MRKLRHGNVFAARSETNFHLPFLASKLSPFSSKSWIHWRRFLREERIRVVFVFEMERKSKWKSEFRDGRCGRVCGSYFHICADILLNLLLLKESSTFGVVAVLRARSVRAREAERQRFWRVSLSFVLCKQNKFHRRILTLFVLLLHQSIKFIFRKTLWCMEIAT